MADSANHFDLGRGQLTITDHELFERLTWFTYVRWGFGLFCLLTLLVAWYGFGVRFRLGDQPSTMAPVVEVILVLFVYNAVFTFLNPILAARRQITRRLIDLIALAQIVCDVVAIAALVHCTGGIENPFVILVVVPVAIVAELLPRGLAYATAAAAAAILNALAWGEQQGWIDHVRVELADGTMPPPTGLCMEWRYVLTITVALTVTLLAIVLVMTTIAARLRAREEQLQRAYGILRSTDETKSLFMRRAEHEMRAPLAAIYSLLETMVQAGQTLLPEQLEAISRARRRTTTLMALVRDLRRYSWFRRPDRIFEVERFSFDAIVTNTIDLFRPQAQQQDLTVSASVSPVSLEGNEEMMRELVTNLVANAVQYTPAGGSVNVSLRTDGDTADLLVSDTGIGITAEGKERIFEEFYRTPEAKAAFQDGTGLGMAIVNRIVQIHHGRMDISDNPGGGTVFRARLPLHHRAEETDR